MNEPAARLELLRIVNMFSLVFGIPLSVGALVSGIVHGMVRSGAWSVTRA